MLHDILKSIPFFTKLSPNQIKRIESILKEAKYPKGSHIFLQNDLCNRVFILLNGKVKASKFSTEGKEYIIKFLNPGDFFGEAALFIDGGCYPASSYAYEDCEVCYFTKDDIKRLIFEDPEIALSVIEVYSSKMLTLIELVEDLSLNNVRTRILHFLYELIPEHLKNSNDKINIQLPFSQSDIASKLGTVREQVSRIFSKLAQDKIIEVHAKEIQILNIKKLKNEALIYSTKN
ncbi:MAG: Crp/Fnr family transcriptional regulator [Spirochaetota bacterium]|nr:Crp/Fnr family transcriptional regulator [Spirochaetota bacterium]